MIESSPERIWVSYGVFYFGSDWDDEAVPETDVGSIARGIIKVRDGLIALRSLTVHSYPTVRVRIWASENDLPDLELGGETWSRNVRFEGAPGASVTEVSVWTYNAGPYVNMQVSPGAHLVRAHARNLDLAHREAEVEAKFRTSEEWLIDVAPTA